VRPGGRTSVFREKALGAEEKGIYAMKDDSVALKGNGDEVLELWS
jgi:hypothetical protein